MDLSAWVVMEATVEDEGLLEDSFLVEVSGILSIRTVPNLPNI